MWMLRSRIIWHRSQKSRILRGRSATTSRGVLEAYSSQKPQFATVRLSMWKGALNNAEGTAKQCIGMMMSFCSILLRFLNCTRQKCGDPTLGVKANRSAPECSSSKADELKAEFSAEWLRIWRYERGIKLPPPMLFRAILTNSRVCDQKYGKLRNKTLLILKAINVYCFIIYLTYVEVCQMKL